MANFSIQSFKDDKVIYSYSIAYLVLSILHFLLICFMALGKGPFGGASASLFVDGADASAVLDLTYSVADSFYRFLQELIFVLIGVGVAILVMVALRLFIKGTVTPKVLIMNGLLTAGMAVIIPIIAGIAFTFKLFPDYLLFILPFSAFGYFTYHVGRKIEPDD